MKLLELPVGYQFINAASGMQYDHVPLVCSFVDSTNVQYKMWNIK